MTNQEANAEHQAYPHLSAETVAYYNGRSSIGDCGEVYWKCGFTDPALIEAFNRGVRHIRSEIRLSADTEWDED